MSPRVFTALCALALLLVPAAAATQQVSDAELIRRVLEADRREIVRVAMELDEDEETAFWPVYDAYHGEREAVLARRTAVTRRFIRDYERLADPDVDAILREWFSLERDLLALRDSYLKRFREVLPRKDVLRYFQVEHKIDVIVNYDLNRDIPLLR